MRLPRRLRQQVRRQSRGTAETSCKCCTALLKPSVCRSTFQACQRWGTVAQPDADYLATAALTALPPSSCHQCPPSPSACGQGWSGDSLSQPASQRQQAAAGLAQRMLGGFSLLTRLAWAPASSLACMQAFTTHCSATLSLATPPLSLRGMPSQPSLAMSQTAADRAISKVEEVQLPT